MLLLNFYIDRLQEEAFEGWSKDTRSRKQEGKIGVPCWSSENWYHLSSFLFYFLPILLPSLHWVSNYFCDFYWIDGKKGGHVATPHPAKQAPKTPAANNDKAKQPQTPKSGGSVSCKSCSK
jgi:hypothetical protein